MSKYVSVSGSLICTDEQIQFIQEVLQQTVHTASTYFLTQEQANLYMRCWSFPERAINWLSYAFFGGSIQSSAIDYLQYQIVFCSKQLQISTLEEKELDGLFYLMDEEGDRFIWEMSKNRLNIYHIDEYSDRNRVKLLRFIDI